MYSLYVTVTSVDGIVDGSWSLQVSQAVLLALTSVTHGDSSLHWAQPPAQPNPTQPNPTITACSSILF